MNNITHVVEFVSIPFISCETKTQSYQTFYPIVMFEGEYDHDIGMTCGTSIRMEPLDNISDALEAAQTACISLPNAIGYTARGVKND